MQHRRTTDCDVVLPHGFAVVVGVTPSPMPAIQARARPYRGTRRRLRRMESPADCTLLISPWQWRSETRGEDQTRRRLVKKRPVLIYPTEGRKPFHIRDDLPLRDGFRRKGWQCEAFRGSAANPAYHAPRPAATSGASLPGASRWSLVTRFIDRRTLGNTAMTGVQVAAKRLTPWRLV